MTRELQGWIRMGIMAEKSILLNNENLYHGLVVPAHVFAMYEMSFSQFLPEINKPYFIDPMTYVLFNNQVTLRDNGEMRKSFEKMFKGCPHVEEFVQSDLKTARGFSESDFNKTASLIADCTIASQTTPHTRKKGKKSLDRLKRSKKQKSDDETPTEIPPPEFITGPYLYIKEFDSDYQLWRMASSEFFSRMKNKKIDVFESLCIDSNILTNEANIARIIEELNPVKGIVLWISDFEKRATEEKMSGLKSLITHSKARGINTVYSLYGGYLTSLFYHFGLDGLSYALSHGDSKPVSQGRTRGGGLPFRYYEPSLHQYLTPGAVSTYYSLFPNEFSCTCSICSSASSSHDESESTETPDYISESFPLKKDTKIMWNSMRQHFLEIRYSELRKIPLSSLSDAADEARSYLNKLSDIKRRLKVKTEYLELISKIDSI